MRREETEITGFHLLNWCRSVFLIAFASVQFHIVQSEQSAVGTFLSLLPKAYDDPALVVAVFHFPGFSASLPCRAGRLLLFSLRRVFAPGCYFEEVPFRSFPLGFQKCKRVLSPELCFSPGRRLLEALLKVFSWFKRCKHM